MLKTTLLVTLAVSLCAFSAAQHHKSKQRSPEPNSHRGGSRTITKQIVVGYKVKPGDSDWTIAHKAGLTVKQLRHLNGGKKLDVLRDGRCINVMKTVTVHVPAPRSRASEAKRMALHQEAARREHARHDQALAAKKARVALVKREAARRHEVAMRSTPRPSTPASERLTTVVITNETLEPTSAPISSAPARQSAPIRTSGRGSVNGILNQANSFRGVRYSYGAMSRAATDCSGFTSQVFRANGYTLPRTSGEQSRVGHPVDRSDLQAGDLVFFRTVRGMRISHVGIFIGDGRFIHASSGGHRVMISPLSDSYYSNRFVTARRVIKDSAALGRVIKTAREAEKTGMVLVDPEPKRSATDVIGN